MPRIIESCVYLEIVDLVFLGIPERTVYWRLRNEKFTTYQSEEHGKLIEFSSLKWDWKKKINEYYDGCVRTYTQLKAIEENLGFCPERDKAYLRDFVLPKGSHLTPKRRKLYEQKCQFLNFLARLYPLTTGKIRAFGVDRKQDFWKLMGEFIQRNSVKLPKNARRLGDLVKKYISLGAAAVISGKLGNVNCQKIGEQERQLIIELYANEEGRKFTAKEVHQQFLVLAKEYGWAHCQDVTYRIVAKVIKEAKGDWNLERNGTKNFRLYNTLTANRRPASGRNLVWQLDGTPEHAWYYDPKRKTVDKLYVFKVMDSKSWKIVGYSIGYTETANLVFEAVKMGVKLTGVRPKEARGDKGSALQAGETKELMHSLGIRYYPTASGNSRGKSIESWQKHFNQRVLTYFPNKSSGNITNKSLDSQQSPDKLKANYKNYPTKAELVGQIRQAIALWNHWSNSKGVCPHEVYEESQEMGKMVDLYEQFELFTVWRMRGKKIHPYRYTMDGLKIEISGEKYYYVPDVGEEELAAFMNRHINTSKFYVKYDPSDLEQIGIYELASGTECKGENMRFIRHLVLKGKTAETSLDATDEEQARYVKIRRVQKLQEQLAKEKTQERRDYLAHNNILSGAIELERIHKDTYNNAELEVQRLELLGYNNEITSDKNKGLSALSSLASSNWLEQETELDEEDGLNGVYGLPKGRAN